MKRLTADWVRKSEGDLLTAEREFVASPPNYDAAAYHAQQAAEKFLKACLIESDVRFPKTHDLPALLDLLIAEHPDWEEMRPNLNLLTSLGLEVRYPGMEAELEEAEEALAIARSVRDVTLVSLGCE